MNIRSPRFLGKRVIIERVTKWHVNDWRRRMAYIANSVDLVARRPVCRRSLSEAAISIHQTKRLVTRNRANNFAHGKYK